MNKNEGNVKKVHKSKKCRKVSFIKVVSLLLFEIIFTATTFPFLLLYGPFENAKRIYIGSAMGTMNTQYLVTWFLSDEKIESIIGKAPSESSDETTNINEVKISKKNDGKLVYKNLIKLYS